MDIAVWEGLSMTNSGTNQQNAAIAVRQAAIDMGYSCAEINAFTDRFEARGYVLPVYTCTGTCAITAISTSNLSPCDDNGTPEDGTDDFFTADVTVTFNDAPATGTLELTGDGTASISVASLTSPHTFVGVTLPSDGGAIDLTATFSDETSCTLNEPNAGTAPDPCITLGIEDNEAASAITIFPNPANNTISMLNVIQEYEITVYNMLGQKIIEQTIDTDNNSIDISNLNLGVYIIKIKDFNKVLRFIKN